MDIALYSKIDQKLHFLSQVIAKVNRSFVPAVADDSHSNMFFDPLSGCIYGRWFTTNDLCLILRLNLNTQAFELINEKWTVLLSATFAGKKMGQVEEELAVALAPYNLSGLDIFSAMHYEMPNYPLANLALETLKVAERKTWTSYRMLANEACSNLSGLAQKRTEIRIWPHHFDTGIYFNAHPNLGVGFGLAMADTLIDEAYFYLSAYPQVGKIDFTNAPEMKAGKWILSPDWNSAVLPISVISSLNYNTSKSVLTKFVSTNYQWLRGQA
jgi:hypothetical protein